MFITKLHQHHKYASLFSLLPAHFYYNIFSRAASNPYSLLSSFKRWNISHKSMLSLLLLWTRKALPGRKNVHVTNETTAFADIFYPVAIFSDTFFASKHFFCVHIILIMFSVIFWRRGRGREYFRFDFPTPSRDTENKRKLNKKKVFHFRTIVKSLQHKNEHKLFNNLPISDCLSPRGLARDQPQTN